MTTRNYKKEEDIMKLYKSEPKSTCCRADVFTRKMEIEGEKQDVFICKKCEKWCDIKPYTLTEIGELMPKFKHKKVSRQRIKQIVKRKLFDNFLEENWDEMVEIAEASTGESYGGREPLLDRETIIEIAKEEYNKRKESK